MTGSLKRVRELRVAARPDQLRHVRDAVRESADAAGCNPECSADIVLAVDEACQNIIRHAYCGEEGTILLQIDRADDDLVFSLHDSAPEIDTERVKPRDLDDVRPGGLGTHFIRVVMDRTEYLRPPSGRGNLLRMVKRIEVERTAANEASEAKPDEGSGESTREGTGEKDGSRGS